MSCSLLLDEMLSGAIAKQLSAKGHDVRAVVAEPELVSLPDEQILEHASAAGRALVTANIEDFVPLDARYRASGRTHGGMILISAKTFPQNRGYVAAVTSGLLAFLDTPGSIGDDRVVFLKRAS
ncbi:MAG: DUF5615 family PIN-like protein [Streptosporangiaceae bacterium]|nr:DUF5615 family PIN-like protein [Streptosporangiaceae bacterium]MBV9856873.1 DUF5615 family PIN-like protein [Streptosporangiaceae bacterium]